MPLPKSRKKLLNLFLSIKDESIRNIISEVIALEYENRSNSSVPRKKIEYIIDNEAQLIEMRNKKEKEKRNEI